MRDPECGWGGTVGQGTVKQGDPGQGDSGTGEHVWEVGGLWVGETLNGEMGDREKGGTLDGKTLDWEMGELWHVGPWDWRL